MSWELFAEIETRGEIEIVASPCSCLGTSATTVAAYRAGEFLAIADTMRPGVPGALRLLHEAGWKSRDVIGGQRRTANRHCATGGNRRSSRRPHARERSRPSCAGCFATPMLE